MNVIWTAQCSEHVSKGLFIKDVPLRGGGGGLAKKRHGGTWGGGGVSQKETWWDMGGRGASRPKGGKIFCWFFAENWEIFDIFGMFWILLDILWTFMNIF